jgi:hypothetical protein
MGLFIAIFRCSNGFAGKMERFFAISGMVTLWKS